MTAGTRYNFTRTLPTAAERLAEFERQDRQQWRLIWLKLAIGVLAVAGWIMALL